MPAAKLPQATSQKLGTSCCVICENSATMEGLPLEN
jgi:hypothetical protein